MRVGLFGSPLFPGHPVQLRQASLGGFGDLSTSGWSVGCYTGAKTCPGGGSASPASPDCDNCDPNLLPVPASLTSAKDNMNFPFAPMKDCGVFEGLYRFSGGTRMKLFQRGSVIVGTTPEKWFLVAKQLQDAAGAFVAHGYVYGAPIAGQGGRRRMYCVNMAMSKMYADASPAISIAVDRCHLQPDGETNWGNNQLANCRVGGRCSTLYMWSLAVDDSDTTSPVYQRILAARRTAAGSTPKPGAEPVGEGEVALPELTEKDPGPVAPPPQPKVDPPPAPESGSNKTLWLAGGVFGAIVLGALVLRSRRG